MKFILPGFLFLFCLIGNGQSGTSLRKSKAGQKNIVPKSVVIYSSDNSFFEDYPIDSLVEHLNLLNKNPDIVYYKNTNDDSKTGFKADYLVDLKLAKNEHEFVIPKIKQVPVSRPVAVTTQEAGGTTRQEISERITHYITTIDYTTEPKTYYLAAQAFRKNPYKKLKLAQWHAKGDVSEKAAIIIKLVYYLQGITH